MESATASSKGGRIRRILGGHETALVIVLGAVFVWAAVADPGFLAWRTQRELSTHVWELALIALPMLLVILAGGIDLSVGSMMALSAVILGISRQAGVPVWAAAGIAVFAGLAAGLTNGLLVALLEVHPLIVTLATMAAFRGLAEGISLGRPYSGFPAGFVALGRGTILGLPIPGVVFLAAAALTAAALYGMPFGRILYALGLNPTAARFSGVRVARVRVLLHGLTGLASGLAAVLYVARRNTAKADIGTGMELNVITAVVLGGVSIMGGRGSLAGALLGILVIHEVREFVGWHWEHDELVFIVLGLLLIFSVGFHAFLERRAAGAAGAGGD